MVIVKTKKQTTTAPPIVDHSIGHLGRRLLNEPNHHVDNEEFASFMKVDEEELSKQLLNMESTMDGSGPSMFRQKNSFSIENLCFLQQLNLQHKNQVSEMG